MWVRSAERVGGVWGDFRFGKLGKLLNVFWKILDEWGGSWLFMDYWGMGKMI